MSSDPGLPKFELKFLTHYCPLRCSKKVPAEAGHNRHDGTHLKYAALKKVGSSHTICRGRTNSMSAFGISGHRGKEICHAGLNGRFRLLHCGIVQFGRKAAMGRKCRSVRRRLRVRSSSLSGSFWRPAERRILTPNGLLHCSEIRRARRHTSRVLRFSRAELEHGGRVWWTVKKYTNTTSRLPD